ncbi:glycosyltransferase [Patescibacteria group bacterium]|nr:MAG: glycosyltransferase [Patescibacteria group bacterium]
MVRDLGMATLVMTKGEPRGTTMSEGWAVLKLSTRPMGGPSRLVHLNRMASLVTWALQARRLRPSIISGHDLLGLLIAWMSTWFVSKNRRPLLVYDSHEFTIALASRRTRWLVRRLESFLMRRCVFSIMVNDGIAERVQQIHSLAEKPVVVRNIPSLWVVDEQKCAQRRADFCRELGLPLDVFLVMYHGVVVPNRGVEVSIRALVGRESVALVVMGDGDPEYLRRLRRLTDELGVGDRVLFHDAVPLEVLGEYAGAADAGMVIVRADTESNYLMLPNKFFENVQSLTPVIASDFPEIGSLVRKYDIGLLVDPDDVSQVGEAIDRLRSDPALRSRLRKNLDIAKAELCWEKEKAGLEIAYSRILREFRD